MTDSILKRISAMSCQDTLLSDLQCDSSCSRVQIAEAERDDLQRGLKRLFVVLDLKPPRNADPFDLIIEEIRWLRAKAHQ
jgi:hypothetical protein